MPRQSSFSENPLLRVSRPVSACSRCRAAKVKCDGKLPACTACEKAGRESECSAANDQFARGKERSYVAALELRIEKLEKRLEYARLRKASVAMHEPEAGTSTDDTRRESLAAIREAIHRKAARKRENSDVNTLVSDFGYMSVNATTRDWSPASGDMTFARFVLAACANDPLPESTTTELPPKQFAESLVQFYMANIYPMYPAFASTYLTRILNSMYQEGSPTIESPESWAFWMVLAIGSTAQSQNTGDEHYQNGLEYITRALPHSDRALMPGYLSQLSALLLLTQYSMLDPAHFDSWHLIGFTCRAVLDLGFHQELPGAKPSEELDTRRRTFYSIYALDRAISMVHARAFSFTDDAISVALPALARTGTGSKSRSAAPDPSIHLFKLRRLQSGWYQTLFQCNRNDPLPDATSFIWKRCLEMREWSESLPEGLPVDLREMLDLELRYSYVYCIAPSSRTPDMTAYGRMLIFEHSIAYIDRIYEVSHNGRSSAFYTYHDALRVYFMGSQFVAVLHDAADALLSAAGVSVPLAAPGQPPPPPVPERFAGSGEDNLDRSLRTVERVSLTLRKFGQRWGYALQLLGNFEMLSKDVMDGLGARRELRAQTLGAEPIQSLQPPPLSQPSFLQRTQMPQHAPSQQAPSTQEVRWVDMGMGQDFNGRLPNSR